ncbi:hypothetical protein CSUI_006892 [Cystoisospora suis]|uniref:Uncharacterized protein n=1 Tax=Cystoisospora suis TaxID=483139 RepID=A0A2C6KQ77_9APIC|nr:hypothetical protein CSUI_006892 [Cystoisospora suis]
MLPAQHQFPGVPPSGPGGGSVAYSRRGSAQALPPQVQQPPVYGNQAYQHPFLHQVQQQAGVPQGHQSVVRMPSGNYQQQRRPFQTLLPNVGHQGSFPQQIQMQSHTSPMIQSPNEMRSVSSSSAIPKAFQGPTAVPEQVSGHSASLPQQPGNSGLTGAHTGQPSQERCLSNQVAELPSPGTSPIQQELRIRSADERAAGSGPQQTVPETNVGKKNKSSGSSVHCPRRGSTGTSKKPTCFDLLYNDALIRRAKKQQEEDLQRAKPRRNVPGRTPQQWEAKWNAMVRKHQDKLISNEALKRRLELSKLEDERRECTFKPVTWSSRKSLREQKSYLSKLQQFTDKQRELKEAMYVLHHEDKKIDDHIAVELSQDINNAPITRESDDDMRALLDFYRRRRCEEANRLCTRKLDILSEASRLEQLYKRTAASGNLDETDLTKSVGFDLHFAQNVRNEITQDIDTANSLRPGARFRAILDAVLMGEAPQRSESPRSAASSMRSYTPGAGVHISTMNRATFGGSPSASDHLGSAQCPQGYNRHGESYNGDAQYGSHHLHQGGSSAPGVCPHSSRGEFNSPSKGPCAGVPLSPPQMEQQHQGMAAQWSAGGPSNTMRVQQVVSGQPESWNTSGTGYHAVPNAQQNPQMPQQPTQQTYAQSLPMSGGFPQPAHQQYPNYGMGTMVGPQQPNQAQAGHTGQMMRQQYPVTNYQSGTPAHPIQMQPASTPEGYAPMYGSAPQQIQTPGHPSYPQYQPFASPDNLHSFGSAPTTVQQWNHFTPNMHEVARSSTRAASAQGKVLSGEHASAPSVAGGQHGQTPLSGVSPRVADQQRKNGTLLREVSPGPEGSVAPPAQAMAAAAKMVGGAMLRMGGNGYSTFVDFASTAKQLQRGGTVPLRG